MPEESIIASCPHCDWSARHLEIKTGDDRDHSVECSNSKCAASTAYWQYKEEAINAWNTRKPLQEVLINLNYILECAYDYYAADIEYTGGICDGLITLKEGKLCIAKALTGTCRVHRGETA